MRRLELHRFFSPAEVEATCGTAVKGVFDWDAQKSVEGTPAVWYNAGPTVEEGQDLCAPMATLPTKTVFMHGALAGSTKSPKFLDAVVRWKAPITGTVTFAGSVRPVDSFVRDSGISWQFDKGQVILASGEIKEDNLMAFGPLEVSVVSGEYFNLELGRAPGTYGNNDSTAVTLTVTSP
jgi:hypothetical protein